MTIWTFAVKLEAVWVGVVGRMFTHSSSGDGSFEHILGSHRVFLIISQAEITLYHVSDPQQWERAGWCHSIAHSFPVTSSVKAKQFPWSGGCGPNSTSPWVFLGCCWASYTVTSSLIIWWSSSPCMTAFISVMWNDGNIVTVCEASRS